MHNDGDECSDHRRSSLLPPSRINLHLLTSTLSRRPPQHACMAMTTMTRPPSLHLQPLAPTSAFQLSPSCVDQHSTACTHDDSDECCDHHCTDLHPLISTLLHRPIQHVHDNDKCIYIYYIIMIKPAAGGSSCMGPSLSSSSGCTLSSSSPQITLLAARYAGL